jgi:glycosyltransferase involved in cell wall biosynthesis
LNKEILIVASYGAHLNGKGRTGYIAQTLVDANFNVEVVTSCFSHAYKSPKNLVDEDVKASAYRYTMLFEPGYKKNVDFKRMRSHRILARNLKKYLEGRNKPDLIIALSTPLSVGHEAAKYARQNNIKFIVNIEDIWPEAFKMVLKIPIVSSLLFYPMKRQADYIYKTADAILGVSDTYVKRGLSVNKKCAVGLSVYLGVNFTEFDSAKIAYKTLKPENEFWVAYIGMLGTSYNISVITDALVILKERGINNIKFIVMGDGPDKAKFEKYAIKQSATCEFTGRLPYQQMVGKLVACDIAVNPLISTAPQSIINKVGDYAAAGLPVVNTLNCQEYKDLLTQYNAGINCENNNVTSIADAIEKLYINAELRNEMGKNSRRLGEELFDKEKTYLQIVELIRTMIEEIR